MFDKVIERFLRHSPVSVLGSLVVQRALDPAWLDEVFRQHRDRTYEKELLFSSVIDLTEVSLQSEVQAPGIPAAALLAFSTACAAYNALSVVQTAIEAAHPICAEQPLSMYYLATELRFASGGVRLALPPEYWEQVAEQSPADLATTLVSVAGSVRVEQFTKTTRGPKKAKPKGYAPAKEVRRHSATARARAAGTVDYGGG